MVKRLAQHIKIVHNKEELVHKCQVCSKVNAIKNMKDIILPSFMNANCQSLFSFTEVSFCQSSCRSHASTHGREAVRMWPVPWGDRTPFEMMHQYQYINIISNVVHLVLLQTFGRGSYLKVHVSTVHLKQKRFKCDECQMVSNLNELNQL